MHFLLSEEWFLKPPCPAVVGNDCAPHYTLSTHKGYILKHCIPPQHNRTLSNMSSVPVFSVFCGLCSPLMSQCKALELSVLDMVCGLSALEAATQCRTGQLNRRADRLTGVNSTGFSLIQTSHSPQCFRNRWLMLI